MVEEYVNIRVSWKRENIVVVFSEGRGGGSGFRTKNTSLTNTCQNGHHMNAALLKLMSSKTLSVKF